jgi:nucleotide-binding universal stress UspA family protein
MPDEQVGSFAPILLVVDSSDAALRAARRAIELAGVLGAKIYATGVVDTQTLGQLLKGKILVQDEMEDFEAELAESAKRYLKMVEGLAKEADIELEPVLLKGGWHQSILYQQRECHAGLVIVGGFTSSMTKRDLVAKAKQLIVDEVPCPVMIIK